MQEKCFFRFSWSKLIITLLLTLIYFYYIFYITNSIMLDCVYPDCPNLMEIAVNKIAKTLVPLLLINYLVACLIVWLYYKIMKRGNR